jgi:hypothetical protein
VEIQNRTDPEARLEVEAEGVPAGEGEDKFCFAFVVERNKSRDSFI